MAVTRVAKGTVLVKLSAKESEGYSGRKETLCYVLCSGSLLGNISPKWLVVLAMRRMLNACFAPLHRCS
jgi:hypothetical protein